MVGGSGAASGGWFVLAEKDTKDIRFIVGYSFDVATFCEMVRDFQSLIDGGSSENKERLRKKYAFDLSEWSENHPIVNLLVALSKLRNGIYITIISPRIDMIFEAVSPDEKYIKDVGDMNLFFVLTPKECDGPLLFGIITNRKNFDGARYLKNIGMENCIEVFEKDKLNLFLMPGNEYDKQVINLLKELNFV